MDADKEQWHHARQIPDLLVNFAHSNKILDLFPLFLSGNCSCGRVVA
jgi:hypothetical protein